MKFKIKVLQEQEVDLSEEDCENILIKTLHKDWYSHLSGCMDAGDEEAIKRVYTMYSAKHLV